MRAPVGVVLKFPQMDKLVDRPRVGLEVPDEVLVVAALMERWETELLVKLHRLGHRADAQRIGPQFVQRHQVSPQSQRPLSRHQWDTIPENKLRGGANLTLGTAPTRIEQIALPVNRSAAGLEHD
jgi:hypothetical protein